MKNITILIGPQGQKDQKNQKDSKDFIVFPENKYVHIVEYLRSLEPIKGTFISNSLTLVKYFQVYHPNETTVRYKNEISLNDALDLLSEEYYELYLSGV